MSDLTEVTLSADLFEPRILHAKVAYAGFDVKLLEFGEESALANTWAEHKLLVREDDLEQVEALLE